MTYIARDWDGGTVQADSLEDLSARALAAGSPGMVWDTYTISGGQVPAYIGSMVGGQLERAEEEIPADAITARQLEANASAASAFSAEELAADARAREGEAGKVGADAAELVVTAQANVGMSPARIEVSAERVLGGQFDDPTPKSGAFYAAYDRTAAMLAAELRELDQPEPDRTPGAAHSDPALARQGWHMGSGGIYTRQADADMEAG